MGDGRTLGTASRQGNENYLKANVDFADPGTETTKLISGFPAAAAQSIALPEIGKTPPCAPQSVPQAPKPLWGSHRLRPLGRVPCSFPDVRGKVCGEALVFSFARGLLGVLKCDNSSDHISKLIKYHDAQRDTTSYATS